MNPEAILTAAKIIRTSNALLITAGAGMGVDSGLPDFRGPQGFWRAYPAYQKLGLRFEELANPRWFERDPELAWGFYGHRMNLYRATKPHAGFDILKKWSARMPQGTFIITSNVDGHFQGTGFDPNTVFEVHGSIHHAQCLKLCGSEIFSALKFNVTVDPETFRASPPLPSCPECGGLARPNILMFGDGDFDHARAAEQKERLQQWLAQVDDGFAVLELGAGSNVPTIRVMNMGMTLTHDARLIRINPREAGVESDQIGIEEGALEALRAIETLLT